MQSMGISSAKMLEAVEKRCPRIVPHLKKFFVEHLVPSNRSMGVRIRRMSSDCSEFELVLRSLRRNRNFIGSVNGGVLLAFAECIHGVATLWKFSPASHRMVTKRAQMEYVAAGFGELYTRFALSSETCSFIASELAKAGTCEVELSSTVTDKVGTEIARLKSTYQIRRCRSESAGGGR